MKAFLKVLLLVMAALIAVKFLPQLFALGWIIGVAIAGLLAIGVSVAAAMFGAMIALVVLLAPIWIPVLVLVGLITLIKRSTRNSGVVAA
jgi:hypothetical protein